MPHKTRVGKKATQTTLSLVNKAYIMIDMRAKHFVSELASKMFYLNLSRCMKMSMRVVVVRVGINL